MLDLDPRVHLDEEELLVLVEELERSRAAIADLAAGIGATLSDPRQGPGRQSGSRSLLDDLLVPALHRAVALEEVDGVLVLVRQHLDLDMAGIAEKLLHVDHRIAERRLGFRARQRRRRDERGFGVHHAHPAAAPAPRCLDDHRITDRAGDLHDLLRVVGKRAFGAGHTGNPRFEHRRLGAYLVAHETDGVGARPDEDEARALDFLGEVRVFRQESVTRMNSLRVGDLGGRNDRRNVEVARRRRRRPDAHRFVGEADVFRLAIGLRVHYDGPDAQLATRPLDAQCDLTSIGDQDLAEELVRILGHDGRRRGTQRRQVRRSRPAAGQTPRAAHSRPVPALRLPPCRIRSRSSASSPR